MEGLNFMIRLARENRWIRGFCANRNMGNAMEISHLLYADDSLVFCEAEVTQIRHLRAILTIFEGISGLHVNWQKSCLYPVNKVPNMQILEENLGCQVASLPTKYLGIPLGAKNKELEVWNVILERSEKTSKMENNNLKYTIGNGEKTSFWNEVWIGEENLKTTFPDMCMLSLQQMDKVAQVWSPQGWNLIFRRAFKDWEINRVAELLQVLNGFPGVHAGPDLPVWKLHNKGCFTVKSCYWTLNYSRHLFLHCRTAVDLWNIGKEWGEEGHKKTSGGAFQHVFGGHYGEKEMKEVMME
ncbi:uncharacterized protein LOC129869922 [Solanum dulcamara]|uniref:uncharacterized protein LOC129869922 n=1 Tax=Solanum dulcamara TaxID=45834 RepID=UPI0024864943|nr:uncharacterized protein LOC129869922 [Solanum dulcamara]